MEGLGLASDTSGCACGELGRDARARGVSDVSLASGESNRTVRVSVLRDSVLISLLLMLLLLLALLSLAAASLDLERDLSDASSEARDGLWFLTSGCC